MKSRDGSIRVGIGGWTYEPWRKTFYPADVAKSRELEYASRQVTAIEINGTFYGLQKPAVFAKWHDATPDGFMFSVKAPRFIVQRKELASAGSAIERFLASGITELKSKLGPHPVAAGRYQEIRRRGYRRIPVPAAGGCREAFVAACAAATSREFPLHAVPGHRPSP